MRKNLVLLCCLWSINTVATAEKIASDELEAIKVKASKQKAKKTPFRYNHLKKDEQQINSQQVQDIRDLTRYEPGIAVNEQGQGTSAGYSMRGVDRNRVVVTVDGLTQAQVFSVGGNWHTDGQYGAAINEVEIENLKQVEVRKGSSGVYAGSGALGGAVMFTTKDPADFFTFGRDKGGKISTGYIGKTNQYYSSTAYAATMGRVSAMLQFTARKGKELQSHRDAKGQYLSFWYNNEVGHPGVSAANQKRYRRYFSAKDVFGPSRELANPMDFKSHSLLAKTNFRLSDGQSLDFIFENTVQDYQQLDLTQPVFSMSPQKFDRGWTSYVGSSAYKYFRSVHKDNLHQKSRLGVAYHLGGLKLFDNTALKFDVQNIKIENFLYDRACAKNLSKNCNLDAKLNGQRAIDYQTGSIEKQQQIRLEAAKKLDLGIFAQHQLYINAGLANTKFNYYSNYWRRLNSYAYNVRTKQSYFKHRHRKYHTNYDSQPIDGKHQYLAVEDIISPHPKLELPVAVRFDSYSYRSDNPYLKNKTYRATSHNMGVIYKPWQSLELAFMHSSGFRVPSYVEQYGFELLFPRYTQKLVKPKDINGPPLKPEQSIQNSFGITHRGDWGYARASTFVADYKHLIGRYRFNSKDSSLQWDTFANVNSAYTQGIEFAAAIDIASLIGVYNHSLEASLSYSKTRPRKVKQLLDPNSSNFIASSFVMDAITPAKAVAGLSYLAPRQNWGVDFYATYSFAKSADELTRKLLVAHSKQTLNTAVVGLTSQPWQTYDLIGHLKLYNRATLRLGVYNLLDEKYIQWENLRAAFGETGTATASRTTVSGVGIGRLSAAGRNFLLTAELKF